MRSIKLTCFLSCIGSKLTDKVLIDESKHIVVLSSIHRYILYQRKKITHSTSLLCIRSAQLLQASLQCVEYSRKHLLVSRRYQSCKSRQGITYIGNLEIKVFACPSGIKVVISNEIAQIVLYPIDCFRIFFFELAQISICEIIVFCKPNFLFGKKLIKNEAKNIVLVFISLNLRAHLVGRCPYFICELLLVHNRIFYPFR